MAEAGGRRWTVMRVIKYLFLILTLLFLLYIGKLLIFNNPVDMLKESLKTMLEESVKMNKEEQNRLETLSRLLDDAKSLKTEEELEIFKQTLRKAVNEAFEQETEMKYRIAASIEQFNDKMKELNHSLEILKRASKTDPTGKRLLIVVERTMRRVKAFLEQRQWAFAVGAEYTEERLNYISNAFKSERDLHDEL